MRTLIAATVAAIVVTISPAAPAATPAPVAGDLVTVAASRPAGAPPCTHEDGSGQRRCVWDARHAGNGHGRSILSTNYGKSWRYISHKRAHQLIRAWRISHRGGRS